MSNIIKRIKLVGSVTANVGTLGGHYRIHNAQAEYKIAYETYLQSCEQVNELSEEQTALINGIGEKTKIAIEVLKDCQDILKKLVDSKAIKESSKNQSVIDVLSGIEKINVGANSALTIAAGGIAGTTVALGSWALVSMVGTASTGAAIGGLSGAAATNATLAWFGGGSLATGGAGMAGGSVALGGIIVLPLVAVGSYFSHRKANKLEAETVVIRKETDINHIAIRKLTIDNDTITNKAKLLSTGLVKLTNVKNKVYTALFPKGFFSRAFRSLRSFFTGKYYNEDDIEYLTELENEVTVFINILNAESSVVFE